MLESVEVNPKFAQFTKGYPNCFLLDRPKLSRIISCIDAKAKALNIPIIYKFGYSTQNGKAALVNSELDFTSTDNSIKNPITRLSLYCNGRNDLDEIDKLSLVIDFNRDTAMIWLSVSCEDHKVGKELLSELDEQVERTIQRGAIFNIKSARPLRPELSYLSVLLLVVIALVGVLAGISAGLWIPTGRQTDAAQKEEHAKKIKELTEVATKASTIDEKINFMFQYDKHFIEHQNKLIDAEVSQKISKTGDGFITARLLFFALPILIITLCLVYLFARCYPKGIFLWGDMEEDYKRIQSIQQAIWIGVIVCILLGGVVNLFSAAYLSYRPLP